MATVTAGAITSEVCPCPWHSDKLEAEYAELVSLKTGKKIGRPRTEAFGSGRGRGRGRGRPRISRGGRGTRNVGAGSEARRAETTTNLDVQAMEANTGASPNRVDEESLNAQEPGISAGEYPQTLVGADERWALDHSATLEGLHEE